MVMAMGGTAIGDDGCWDGVLIGGYVTDRKLDMGGGDGGDGAVKELRRFELDLGREPSGRWYDEGPAIMDERGWR